MEIKQYSNGFAVTFANKFTASVRWGYGNYVTALPLDNTTSATIAAKDVEIAILSPNGDFARLDPWIPVDGWDDVTGYFSIEDLPAFLQGVKEMS